MVKLPFEELLEQEIPKLGGSFGDRVYGESILYSTQIDDVMGEDTVENGRAKLAEAERDPRPLAKLLGALGFGTTDKLSADQRLVAEDLLVLFRRKGKYGHFSFEYEVSPLDEDKTLRLNEENVNRLLASKRFYLESIWVMDPEFEREGGGLIGYMTVFSNGIAKPGKPGEYDGVPDAFREDAIRLFGAEEADRRIKIYSDMGNLPYDPRNLFRGITEFMKK